MTRYVIVIQQKKDRDKVKTYIDQCPYGTRVELKAPRRTLPQNSRMWAMLTDVSEQVLWHGERLRPDEWKLIFLAALNRELRLVPNINGDGFVNLGTSSSDLSKGEMGDLMELIAAFGAEHGVALHD